MSHFTGRDLLNAGFPEGPAFGEALKTVNFEFTKTRITPFNLQTWVDENKPAPRMELQSSPQLIINLEANTDSEIHNKSKVIETMTEVMKTPVVQKGVVMPDACPAGPIGTIPVGGVIASKGSIHPGMHSADICCSMAVTEFKSTNPKALLDAIETVTHFGPGGRKNGHRFSLSPKMYDAMKANPFLSSNKAIQLAVEHMGTQGDGNHFAFVGVNQEGNTCLVTHHGSRGPGALLYVNGMKVAEKMTRALAVGVLKQNSWIPAESQEGENYWEALQIIRKWTKANHSCLHTAAADLIGAKVKERHWNEHNFVFRDTDDLFYHAKGATPIHKDFLPDTNGIQIVPLNMTQPVLLIEGTRTDINLGFAPHGAGRNVSRTQHQKQLRNEFYAEKATDEYILKNEQSFIMETFLKETNGIDARFFSGNIDITELPSAYKDGPAVKRQMHEMGLATVIDEIQPYGSIMAGDWGKRCSLA